MRPPLFYGWFIAGTLFVVNFATHATGTLSLGLFIIPMGTELGLSRAVFGWLTTARSLASGASSVFLGEMVDRFGTRLVIPAAALVTGLSLIGMGVAGHVSQLFVAFAAMGLAGLSMPGGGLLTSVPVAKWFVRKRGRALAVATLGLGVGAIVFLPITQLLIDTEGWRRTWVYLGIVTMALIIPPSLAFLRRQPEDMGLLPDGDAQPSDRALAEPQANGVEEAWSVAEAFRTRAFWQLSAAFVLNGFAMGAAVHRIPYWVERGFDERLVSLAFSTDAVGATATILATGVLVERFPSRFVSAASFAGFAAAVALMLVGSSAVHMFASVILFGVSVGVNMICQTYLWATYYGRAFQGAIRGITFPAVLVATAAGAPVVGYIYDRTGGYEPAWRMLIVVYALALVVMMSATPPRRRQAAAIE